MKKPPESVQAVTARDDREARMTGLNAGAEDFLTKPLSPSEVRVRVRNLLETRMLHRRIADRRDELERAIKAVQRGTVNFDFWQKKLVANRARDDGRVLEV